MTHPLERHPNRSARPSLPAPRREITATAARRPRFFAFLAAMALLVVACSPDAGFGVSGTWRGSAASLPVRVELREGEGGALSGDTYYNFGAGEIRVGPVEGTVAAGSRGANASISFLNAFRDGSGSAEFVATLDTPFELRDQATEMRGQFILRAPSGSVVARVALFLSR